MASGTQDEEPRRRNLKQGRILKRQHGYPHLLLISRFAREGKRKDEYCNDSTVTHTCCSLVGYPRRKQKEKTSPAMTARSPTPAPHSYICLRRDTFPTGQSSWTSVLCQFGILCLAIDRSTNILCQLQRRLICSTFVQEYVMPTSI